MHRIHLRVVAPERRVRPAKVISLESRRAERAARIEKSESRPKPAA